MGSPMENVRMKKNSAMLNRMESILLFMFFSSLCGLVYYTTEGGVLSMFFEGGPCFRGGESTSR